MKPSEHITKFMFYQSPNSKSNSLSNFIAKLPKNTKKLIFNRIKKFTDYTWKKNILKKNK